MPPLATMDEEGNEPKPTNRTSVAHSIAFGNIVKGREGRSVTAVLDHVTHTSKASLKKERSMIMMAVAALMLAILASSFSTWMIISTRELHATAEAPLAVEGMPASSLVDRAGAPVATSASVDYSGGIGSLPSLVGSVDFNNIKSVTLPLTSKNGSPSLRGVQVLGWEWYNMSAMDFFLATGENLRIRDGKWVLAGAASQRRRLEAEEIGQSPRGDDEALAQITQASTTKHTPEWRCFTCKKLVSTILNGGSCLVLDIAGTFCPPPTDFACPFLINMACKKVSRHYTVLVCPN